MKKLATPAVYRKMEPKEFNLALALGRCRFPTGCFSKRFARDIAAQAIRTGEITEKQAGLLLVQVWIYRRQIPLNLLPESAPAGYQTPTERCKAPVGRIVDAVKGRNIQHPIGAGANGEGARLQEELPL